jgi:hypothetical protein
MGRTKGSSEVKIGSDLDSQHKAEYSKIAGTEQFKVVIRDNQNNEKTKHIQRTTLENGVVKNKLVGLTKAGQSKPIFNIGIK